MLFLKRLSDEFYQKRKALKKEFSHLDQDQKTELLKDAASYTDRHTQTAYAKQGKKLLETLRQIEGDLQTMHDELVRMNGVITDEEARELILKKNKTNSSRPNWIAACWPVNTPCWPRWKTFGASTRFPPPIWRRGGPTRWPN